jgi:hypothetical protein
MWYVRDLGLPFLASVAIALAGRWLFPTEPSRIAGAALLGIISCVAFAAAVLVVPHVRSWALDAITNRFAAREG